MIGRLAMAVYERFEGAYAGALSQLARNPLFLAQVGRLHAARNLHKRLSDRALESVLRRITSKGGGRG